MMVSKTPEGPTFHPHLTLQHLQQQRECRKGRGEGRLGNTALQALLAACWLTVCGHARPLRVWGLGSGVSRGGATGRGRQRSVTAGPLLANRWRLHPDRGLPSTGGLGPPASGKPPHTGSWALMVSVDQSDCAFPPRPARQAQRPSPGCVTTLHSSALRGRASRTPQGRVGLGVGRWSCGMGQGFSNSEVKPGVPTAGPETDTLPRDSNRGKDPSPWLHLRMLQF